MGRARVAVASQVIQSDAYAEMSAEAQAAYPQLMLAANCDGMIEGPARVLRGAGLPVEVLAELAGAGFIIEAGGELFITDWWVNNLYRADGFRTAGQSPGLDALTTDTGDPHKGRYILKADARNGETANPQVITGALAERWQCATQAQRTRGACAAKSNRRNVM